MTKAALKRALAITALGDDYRSVGTILDERAFVNRLVGLNATGGSTNLQIHLITMGKACGAIEALAQAVATLTRQFRCNPQN